MQPCTHNRAVYGCGCGTRLVGGWWAWGGNRAGHNSILPAESRLFLEQKNAVLLYYQGNAAF